MTDSPPASAIQQNLAALADVCPSLTELLARTPLPDSFQSTIGRDGSRTFLWSTPDGQTNWLGRTSMPTISAPALLESFDPGMGNVLLYTFGQGEEVTILLEKLHPHQAVFVIEPSIEQLRAALELHDFVDAIRSRRLCLLAGDDAWNDMQAFLEAHRGFLVPQRILGRPWFDSSLIHDLRQRLSELTNRVIEARGSPVEIVAVSTDKLPALGIISNLASADVRKWAADLADAAQHIGWIPHRFVLDDPSMVEPAAIQRELVQANCAAMLVIGVCPGSLPYSLPPVPTAVLTLPDDPMPQWLSKLPEGSFLVTPATEDSSSATHRSVFLPGAVPDRCAGMTLESGDAVAIVADYLDITAQSVGLTLASHQHLWRAAEELLRREFSRYVAQDVGRAALMLLGDAEQKLGFKLQSPEVRQGLADRLAGVLIPGVFRERLIQVIRQAGRDVILLGEGWNECNGQGDSFRGWTAFGSQQWSGVGHAVFPSDTPHSRLRALFTAALGIPVILQGRRNADEVQDPIRLIPRFSSPDDALRQIERQNSQKDSTAEIRKQLLEQHTWSVRLKNILDKLR